MKKIISSVLVFVLALSLAACGSSSDSTSSAAADTTAAAKEDTTAADDTEASAESEAAGELAVVRAAIMTDGASHWYAVIGKETGIYEKHGIDLEITEFAAGVNTVDAVVTGQADFGNLADYACVNRLGSTQDNTNLVIVDRLSTSEGTGNSQLYVSDEINSIEDLAGKGFASQAGTVWDYWVAKTYEAAGIAEEDQNVLNIDSPASAVAIMISGEADAYWTNGANAAKLEEAGFKSILTTDDLGLYTDAYNISTSDYVNANPEVVEAYIAAQEEIAEWIYANEDEAAEIFEEVTGCDQEQFHQNLEGTRLVTDFTQETLEHLDNIKEWAVGEGKFADYEILDFTDLTALKNVYPESITIEE